LGQGLGNETKKETRSGKQKEKVEQAESLSSRWYQQVLINPYRGRGGNINRKEGTDVQDDVEQEGSKAEPKSPVEEE